MEVIGTYDPIPRQDPYDATTKPHKEIRLDSLRARYWIGVGAQPTDTVWRLLSMVRTVPNVHYVLRHDADPTTPTGRNSRAKIQSQRRTQHCDCYQIPQGARSNAVIIKYPDTILRGSRR